MRRTGRNVSLTPQLQRYVARKLKTGRYQTASEVVREALRLLEEQDRARQVKLADLRQTIKAGLADIDERRFQSFDRKGLKKLADEVKSEGRRRLTRRRKRA